MQILVRCISGKTVVLRLRETNKEDPRSVDSLKLLLAEKCKYSALPGIEYVFRGRTLESSRALESYGVETGSTVHQTYRLLGGKGGFGAMLRGIGRTGKLTDNFDACRDLSGRRIRHQEGEKKLKEWAEEAKERELEKIAQSHIKQQLKEQKQRKKQEEEERIAQEVQQTNIKGVKQAVLSGLAASGSKRKAPGEDASPESARGKSLKLWGMDSDSDSEDGDEQPRDATSAAELSGEQHPGDSSADERTIDTAVAAASTAAKPACSDGAGPEDTPPPSQQEPGKQPTAEDGEKGAPPAEVDLGEYSSAEELEALGLERLKAELQRRGLKCGGSLRQRAERLYLLKTTPPEELDRSLFAKK
mmetsp:Transcript_2949/g.6916  ORF Transcript_2949/g.6916 Transcript_2949/m.6916 type:complete len:360 (-) Transcript_2949:131-1210(-)